jgi:hypothetical protein
MDERLKRFRACDHRLYPYIEKVLGRVPEEVKERVLNDASFQFITMYEKISRFCLFDTPIEKLAVLKERILTLPEYECIFTIAYKIAQYCIEKGEAGSSRKEVENQLISWDFEREMELVKYHRGLYESVEFDVGYLWAKGKEDKFLWVVYEECYKLLPQWDEGTLSEEEWDKLVKVLNPKEVMYAMGWLPKMSQPDKAQLTRRMDDKLRQMATIYGIMSRLKEIKLRKEEKGEIEQSVRDGEESDS